MKLRETLVKIQSYKTITQKEISAFFNNIINKVSPINLAY